MNFNLVRPCPHCPFRTDIPGYLRGARAQEIATSLAEGAMFPCHKTTDLDDEDELTATADSQQCAGALILMEKMEQPNQAARMAERVGLYDASRLDMDAPVARSYVEFIDHHAGEEVEEEPCSVCNPGCLAPAGFLVNGVVVRSVDNEPVTPCEDCGEFICENCADGDLCPSCAEYALEEA